MVKDVEEKEEAIEKGEDQTTRIIKLNQCHGQLKSWNLI